MCSHTLESQTYHMVVVESARILVDGVQLLAQSTERPAIDAVTVCRSHDFRPSLMNGAVNHECSSVQQPAFTTINHFALVVDLDEIGFLDQGKGHAERVDPERIRLDRVTKRNVACYSLVEPVLSKDSESRCEPALEIFTLFILVLEFERAARPALAPRPLTSSTLSTFFFLFFFFT